MTTVSTVDAYARMASLSTADLRQQAWVQEYQAAFPAIFDKYLSSWGNPAACAKAAVEAPDLLPRIREREQRMQQLLAEAPSRLADAGIPAEPVDIVLMVGGRTSNGWVTPFEGKVTLFIALEFLHDDASDEILALHEWFHVIHHQCSGAMDWEETVGLSVFVEGMAVAATRLLLPGAPDSRYLWFDDDHAAWVADCEAQSKTIVDTAEKLWDSTSDEGAGFFSTKPSSSLPPRCGYWLGDRLVNAALADGDTLESLLRLDAASARDRLRDVMLARAAG